MRVNRAVSMELALKRHHEDIVKTVPREDMKLLAADFELHGLVGYAVLERMLGF